MATSKLYFNSDLRIELLFPHGCVRRHLRENFVLEVAKILNILLDLLLRRELCRSASIFQAPPFAKSAKGWARFRQMLTNHAGRKHCSSHVPGMPSSL